MAVGADLVTFFSPQFWKVRSEDEVVAYAMAEGGAFWSRMFDCLHDAGVRGLELTFPPFDREGAVAAFGSEAALAAALRTRGLEVWSCFFADLDRIPVTEYATREDEILSNVVRTARFLAAMGGRVLVVGLPCRTTFLSEPPTFVDLDFATPIANLLNRMGACAAREGISLALHTEASSVFCASRDVDLFMLLTDPRYVGLCPDPAHLTIEGGDPVAVVARHLDRVVAMHWKDAAGIMPPDIVIDTTIHAQHRPYFRELAHGSVDFDALAALLAKAPLRCGPILELDACADPVPVLRRGAAFALERIGTKRA